MKYKVKTTIEYTGTVIFLTPDGLLESFNKQIFSPATMGDIAEHVLIQFSRGFHFVEGVGKKGEDFEIESYEEWVEDCSTTEEVKK